MMNGFQKRIAKAFSKAANNYDRAARVQQAVAKQLAQRVINKPLVGHFRVLEIGAGTGFLSGLLLNKISGGEWIITDISAKMLHKCREQITDSRAQFFVTDANKPPAGNYDLIISSLAFQWLDDLPSTIQLLTNRLVPDGRLLFSTLGVDTFREWKQLYQKCGWECGTLSYPSAEELERLRIHQGDLRIEQEWKIEKYDDGWDFVKSLKTIGANTPRPHYQLLPPRFLKNLLQSAGPNFCVTYHVLYGSITRDFHTLAH